MILKIKKHGQNRSEMVCSLLVASAHRISSPVANCFYVDGHNNFLMLQTFLLFTSSIVIQFKCLLQFPSLVELILSSLCFTRPVPGAGHGTAVSHMALGIAWALPYFCPVLFFFKLELERRKWKRKTHPVFLFFPFPTSAVGCQLPAFLSLHPLLTAVLSTSEVCRNKGLGDCW